MKNKTHQNQNYTSHSNNIYDFHSITPQQTVESCHKVQYDKKNAKTDLYSIKNPYFKRSSKRQPRNTHQRIQYLNNDIMKPQPIINKTYNDNLKKIKSWEYIPKYEINQCISKDQGIDSRISSRLCGKQDRDNFYEYWKNKALEYQQKSFELQKQNNKLKNQIQILKYRVRSAQKKLKVEPYTRLEQKISDLSQYYEDQIIKLNQSLQLKQKYTQKQNIKINSLNKIVAYQQKQKKIFQNLQKKVEIVNSNSIYSSDDFNFEKGFDTIDTNRLIFQKTATRSSSKPNLFLREDDSEIHMNSMCKVKTKNSASIYNRSQFNDFQ